MHYQKLHILNIPELDKIIIEIKDYFNFEVFYFNEKKDLIKKIDEDKKFIAQTKLMMMHFFHDALKNYAKDAEFWKDLLYLGMKVGKRFAPHAKIS